MQISIRLLITYILSLLDLCCTLYLVHRYGLDVEANPIGRLLLTHDWIAIVYKVIVVGAALGALYYFRSYQFVQIISWILLAIFCVLFLYEVGLIGYLHYITYLK